MVIWSFRPSNSTVSVYVCMYNDRKQVIPCGIIESEFEFLVLSFTTVFAFIFFNSKDTQTI